jgi:hypothetical protein
MLMFARRRATVPLVVAEACSTFCVVPDLVAVVDFFVAILRCVNMVKLKLLKENWRENDQKAFFYSVSTSFLDLSLSLSLFLFFLLSLSDTTFFSLLKLLLSKTREININIRYQRTQSEKESFTFFLTEKDLEDFFFVLSCAIPSSNNRKLELFIVPNAL